MHSRRVALGAVGLLAIVAAACGASGSRRAETTVIPPTSTDAPVVPTVPDTVAATSTSTTTTTIAPTTTTVLATPPPSLVSAHPRGDATEGRWSEIFSIGGVPVMWKTWVRSVPENIKSLAWAVVFDQSRLSAALYNGIKQPGGSNWRYRARISGAEVPAVVASFNGGFDFHNERAGYYTEGRLVNPMLRDRATLGIDKNGRLTLGIFGRTIFDDGTWVSLRQNLPPVVIDGKSSIDEFPGTYWGDNYGGVTTTYRSALCTIADGRLMYVAMGMQPIRQFVNGLVNMGCITGMELDNNGKWVRFFTYDGLGTGVRKGRPADPRMGVPQQDFRNMDKEMFVLFDPALRPVS